MQGNFFDEGKILWRQKITKKQAAVKCVPTTVAFFVMFIIIAVLMAVSAEENNKAFMVLVTLGLGTVCTAAAFGSMFYTSGGNEKNWKTEYFITATRAIISANGGRLEREINLKEVKSVTAKRYFGSKRYGTLTFKTGGSAGTAVSAARIRFDGNGTVMKFVAVENVDDALKIAQAAVKQCQSGVTKFSTNVF